MDEGKVFNDPIHGHIEMPKICVKIIDTPEFQRLRNIKQLGTCYLVYTAANHTRFEHALGTAHLAGKLLRSIIGKAEKSKDPRGKLKYKIEDKDVLCVQIAALCHDIGFGPFAHVFDRNFSTVSWRKERGWQGYADVSVDIFEEIRKKIPLFEELFEEEDLCFIRDVIGQKETKSGNPKPGFLYKIVGNKDTGIDVCKWDYLGRDSYMLGIRSNFNVDRCIHFSKVLQKNGGVDELDICYREKEVDNLIDMFHTRYLLHKRAYQHKTKNIIDIMITQALTKADPHIKFEGRDEQMLRMSEAIEKKDTVAYSKITDSLFSTILSSNSEHQDMKDAKDLLNRINKRKLFKLVAETRIKNVNKRFDRWTSIHDTDGLKYAAGREKKDLTEFSYYGQATIPHDFVEIDRNAEDIMIKCDLSSVGVPSLATGNGNCLFNAVSIALTGNESLAMELRLRTAIEMTLNSDIYLSRSDFQQLSDHSPEYKESLLSCYKDGESSSIWTVMALSNVVGKPIQTLYPAMNGPQDQAIGALSKLFSSPDVVGTEQITILWTRMGPRPNPIWTANHFVPVFKTHYSEQIGEQTFKQQTSTPLISRKRKASVAFTDMHGNEVTVTEIKDLPGTLHASRIEADQSEIEQSFTNTTLNCTENLLPTPENVNQTTSGRWMTADEVFRTISEKTFVHMEVPPGDKSNCYMLVDNKRNVDKFMNKRSSEFYDDCGVWDRSKGNTVKSTFINESGRLRSVEYKNNMYCLKRRVQGKVVWEALDPQPEPDQVLILCRYYAILKRNANFQKRVTYITKINNPHFGAVALYEYAGKYTLQTESHGNSKKGSGYVRSNPKTVDKIKEHVKGDQLPREIFKTLKKDDSINCPRDFKAVRNIRYNENRKENNHRPAKSNVADEILDVLSKTNARK